MNRNMKKKTFNIHILCNYFLHIPSGCIKKPENVHSHFKIYTF